MNKKLRIDKEMEIKDSISKELKCYNCNKKITVKNNKLVNAVGLLYKDDGKEIKILKCKSCYKKDPSLTNFQECEVYSRIIGYLRPIKQWNPGKEQEFKERKIFKIKKERK